MSIECVPLHSQIANASNRQRLCVQIILIVAVLVDLDIWILSISSAFILNCLLKFTVWIIPSGLAAIKKQLFNSYSTVSPTFLQRACVQWKTHPLICTSGRSRRKTLHRAFSKSMVIWQTSGSTGNIWRIDFRTCSKKEKKDLNNSSWNSSYLTCHLNQYLKISSLWLLSYDYWKKNYWKKHEIKKMIF